MYFKYNFSIYSILPTLSNSIETYEEYFDPELKWVPAPIPIYTPAPFHNVVWLTSYNNTCIEKFQQKYTKNLPVMLSTRSNVLINSEGEIKNVELSKLTKKIDVYDEAIFLFHHYASTYFHFILEMFMNLLYYDRETLNSSIIIHSDSSFMKGLYKELIEIFDLQFLKHKTIRRPVYVKLLHVFTPTQFCEANPNGVRHFRSLILKKLGIENLSATEFVLYNRTRKLNRKIRNFPEVVDALSQAFPAIHFQIVPYKFDSYVDQIKFWRKVKFLASVHCSIMTNLVYMHPNTVYLEYAVPHCDAAGALLAKTLGIQMYSIKFPRQERNSWLFVEIPALINAIELAIKYLKSHDLTLV